MPPISALETLADRIEHADALDDIAAKVQGLIRRVLPPAADGMLRGEPLGHPLHRARSCAHRRVDVRVRA